jgi:copper transport protein
VALVGRGLRVRWRSVRKLLVVGGLLASLALPATAVGHALLHSSEPSAGSTLGTAPKFVLLTFGEKPDPRLTSVKVLDSAGQDHVTGDPTADGDPPDSVRVQLGQLSDGVYTVSWRTVSSVDGHTSAGSFVFGVRVAPPTGAPGLDGGGGTSQSGTPPNIIARWILYLGFVALIGAAFAAVAVTRRPAPDLLTMAAAGWLLAAAGTLGVIAVQWIETGAPLEELPGTSVGLSALARVIWLALMGAALAGLATVARLRNRLGWWVVGIAGAIGIGVDVATGHAAAGASPLLQVATQWLHGLAAAWWMGGLAALLLLLRSIPAAERLDAARRYSFWAGIALALVILTGLIRAVVEIGTPDALFATDFGRVVLAKSVILLGIAALGGFNRFINLRNAARVLGGVRRVGSAELVLAVLVFGFSALLVNLTPPTSAGANPQPAARPIVAAGHDFGTSVRARLVATPGAAGSNTFDLALVDYDSGDPLDASAVRLRFQLQSQSGVAPSTLDLQRAGPGHFTADASNLSIDGIWQLTATVTAAGAAVDVPLLVATTVASQPVQTSVSPGLPTIYTVQLGAVGSAQVYLDPGGPGQNELHVTFFDPAGAELPTESATIAVFPAAGDATVLPPRMLEPGHFVATMDATAGDLGVDALSPLPGPAAGRIHVHVTIEVSP